MCDDLLKNHPERVPARPAVGLQPQISDAELVTLAVIQALLGYTSERRWLRHARARLLVMFPTLPRQPGYNKRLRKLAATMSKLITALGSETSVATDDMWVIDSTPVECTRSRETVKRSDLAGWAEYGHCASHSRFFWGLRLHLVCTPTATTRTCPSSSATDPTDPVTACSTPRRAPPTRRRSAGRSFLSVYRFWVSDSSEPRHGTETLRSQGRSTTCGSSRTAKFPSIRRANAAGAECGSVGRHRVVPRSARSSAVPAGTGPPRGTARDRGWCAAA